MKYVRKKLQISIIEENYILSQSLDFNHMIGRNANIHVFKVNEETIRNQLNEIHTSSYAFRNTIIFRKEAII